MDIEYVLNEDDYLKFHRYSVAFVPRMKWRYRLFRWVIPIGIMVQGIWLVMKTPHDSTDKIYGMGFLCVSLLLLIGAPRLYDRVIRMSFRNMMSDPENSLLRESVRLLLLPDKMQITTASSHKEYGWDEILKVTEIPAQYLFWVSEHDAVIVPKRAFQMPDQQAEFEQTFQRIRCILSGN